MMFEVSHIFVSTISIDSQTWPAQPSNLLISGKAGAGKYNPPPDPKKKTKACFREVHKIILILIQ